MYDFFYIVIELLHLGRARDMYYAIVDYTYLDSGTLANVFMGLFARIPFNIIGLIFALLVLGAFILLGVFNKKIRALAFSAGAVNFLAMALVPWWVRMHHTIPTYGFLGWLYICFKYSFQFPNHIINLAMNGIMLVVRSINILIVLALVLVAFILSTICLLKCLKGKGRIVAIFAILINVVRFLLFRPYGKILPIIYNVICLFVKMERQGTWLSTILVVITGGVATVSQWLTLTIYGCLVLLPIYLVLIPCLIDFIKEKKAKKLSLVEENTEDTIKEENEAEAEEEGANIKEATEKEKPVAEKVGE